MELTQLNQAFLRCNLGRSRGLLVLGALLSTASVAMAERLCQSDSVYARAGPVESHWQEFDLTSATLLTEHGQLMQKSLGWQGGCGEWQVQLEVAQTKGERLYKGKTNTGAAVQTVARISGEALDAQLWHPFSESWSWGGRYLWRRTSRDLKSVGSVAGYVENYDQSAWGVGLQHALTTSDWGRLQSRVWYGQGLSSHVSVKLPSFDRVTLPLGNSKWWAAQLLWSGCRSAEGSTRWSCDVALDYHAERIQRGLVQPLYRNGVPRAVANQPATNQHALAFKLGFRYQFD